MTVLFFTQATAWATAFWVFRNRLEAPLLAWGCLGNPAYWTIPLAAVTLGPEAAAALILYDFLFIPDTQKSTS